MSSFFRNWVCFLLALLLSSFDAMFCRYWTCPMFYCWARLISSFARIESVHCSTVKLVLWHLVQVLNLFLALPFSYLDLWRLLQVLNLFLALLLSSFDAVSGGEDEDEDDKEPNKIAEAFGRFKRYAILFHLEILCIFNKIVPIEAILNCGCER